VEEVRGFKEGECGGRGEGVILTIYIKSGFRQLKFLNLKL